MDNKPQTKLQDLKEDWERKERPNKKAKLESSISACMGYVLLSLFVILMCSLYLANVLTNDRGIGGTLFSIISITAAIVYIFSVPSFIKYTQKEIDDIDKKIAEDNLK